MRLNMLIFAAMEKDMLIGIIIIIAAVSVLTVLTFWCKKIIEQIDRTGHKTARQTMMELKNDKQA